MCWIPNPGVPCLKPLGGSKVDSAFWVWSDGYIPWLSGNLVVKSKLPPCSGFVALRQLNTIYKKGHKVDFFLSYPLLIVSLRVTTPHFCFLGRPPTSMCHFFCPSIHPSVAHHFSGTVHHLIIIYGTHV